jgi:hypothetical protein
MEGYTMINAVESQFDPKLLELSVRMERVPFTSREQIQDLIDRGNPAILTGALQSWPASKKWTPEYFLKTWGERSVVAYETRWSGKTPYECAAAQSRVTKKFADFMTGALGERSCDLYVYSVDAETTFPGSVDDLDYSSIVDLSRMSYAYRGPKIWLGTPGTQSGLHADTTDNFIPMFYGSKAFVLIDPFKLSLVYPSRANVFDSQIDPRNIDWKRFYRLERARAYIDVLRSGELLFIPHSWWHYLTSLEFSINSTCSFRMGNNHSNRPEFWTDFIHSYVPRMLRCGPSYVLRFVLQMIWHGICRVPSESKALTSIPMGAAVWNQILRDLSKMWNVSIVNVARRQH